MLEKLHKAALALAPLQRFCLLAVAALCAVIALSVFEISVFAGDAYLIPSFVGVLWLLSLYSFIVCFRSLPARESTGPGWFARLRHKMLRGLYWAIALLLLGVTISVLLVSWRFLKVWSAS